MLQEKDGNHQILDTFLKNNNIVRNSDTLFKGYRWKSDMPLNKWRVARNSVYSPFNFDF